MFTVNFLIVIWGERASSDLLPVPGGWGEGLLLSWHRQGRSDKHVLGVETSQRCAASQRGARRANSAWREGSSVEKRLQARRRVPFPAEGDSDRPLPDLARVSAGTQHTGSVPPRAMTELFNFFHPNSLDVSGSNRGPAAVRLERAMPEAPGMGS